MGEGQFAPAPCFPRSGGGGVCREQARPQRFDYPPERPGTASRQDRHRHPSVSTKAEESPGAMRSGLSRKPRKGGYHPPAPAALRRQLPPGPPEDLQSCPPRSRTAPRRRRPPRGPAPILSQTVPSFGPHSFLTITVYQKECPIKRTLLALRKKVISIQFLQTGRKIRGVVEQTLGRRWNEKTFAADYYVGNFETVAVTLWLAMDNLFYLFNFSYIGIAITLGTFLFLKNTSTHGRLPSCLWEFIY